MKDEEVWEQAVQGEDSRGRLFGFGKKSRNSKSTRVLETLQADISTPTRSTATSAEDPNRQFSKEKVEALLTAERARFAAERARFASDIVAQDERHKSELAEFKRNTEYSSRCFATLFQHMGVQPPSPPPPPPPSPPPPYEVSN